MQLVFLSFVVHFSLMNLIHVKKNVIVLSLMITHFFVDFFFVRTHFVKALWVSHTHIHLVISRVYYLIIITPHWLSKCWNRSLEQGATANPKCFFFLLPTRRHCLIKIFFKYYLEVKTIQLIPTFTFTPGHLPCASDYTLICLVGY